MTCLESLLKCWLLGSSPSPGVRIFNKHPKWILRSSRQPVVVEGFWAEGNAEWHCVHVIGWLGDREKIRGRGGRKSRNYKPIWLVNWWNTSQTHSDVATPFHCHHGYLKSWIGSLHCVPRSVKDLSWSSTWKSSVAGHSPVTSVTDICTVPVHLTFPPSCNADDHIHTSLNRVVGSSCSPSPLPHEKHQGGNGELFFFNKIPRHYIFKSLPRWLCLQPRLSVTDWTEWASFGQMPKRVEGAGSKGRVNRGVRALKGGSCFWFCSKNSSPQGHGSSKKLNI